MESLCPKHLILVRHGESEGDGIGKFARSVDVRTVLVAKTSVVNAYRRSNQAVGVFVI